MSILLLIILAFSLVDCLYINISQNKQKCFYDTFFEDMVIIINYAIQDQDVIETLSLEENNNQNSDRFEVTLYSKETDKLVTSFYSRKLSDKFSQTIEKSDEYKICFRLNDPLLFRKRRVLKLSFKIDTNEDILDETAKMKDFNMVNDKVKTINRKISNLETVQKYQVKAESKFFSNQLDNSKLVVKITFVQIFVILLVGGYHIYTLRNILKRAL